MILDKFREEDKYVASFCMRVNGKNLLNQRRENAKKESIAQKIIASIMIRRSKKEHSKDIVTIIPSFDINYQELFKDYIKNEEGSKKKLNSDIVNQNFEIIEGFFGFVTPERRIEQLNNQSMIPLEFIFSDFVKVDDQIDYTDGQKKVMTVLDKRGKEVDRAHMVHFVDRNFDDPEDKELMPGSDFMLLGDSKKIQKFIPGYISSAGIKLIYNRHRHGRSYKT